MDAKKITTICLCSVLVILAVNVNSVQTQDIGTLLKGMDFKAKVMFLADYLFNHNETFNQLEDILVAALPIMDFDRPPNILADAAFPWLLDSLPYLLKNDEFLGIMEILINELNNHKLTPDFFLHDHVKTAEDRDYFMKKLFSVMDYYGMAADILAYKSARDFVPYNTTDRALSEQCYNDTMSFIDRLLVGDDWALNMFDAIGKPTTGIKKGVLYFLGTYDQCQAVDAHIPAGSSLGQYKADDNITFKGRYCRSTFVPPMGLVASVAGDHINNTYGIPLTVSWGMCLPDSCHKEDIEGLLNLGLLGSLLNVSVAEAVCTEDQPFDEDVKAHVVIGILGGLILLVLISSTIELLCLRPNYEKDNRNAGLYAMSDLTAHDNVAYDMPESKTTATETNGNVKHDKGIPNGKLTNTISPLNTSVDSDLTANNFLADSELVNQGIGIKLLRSFSIFTNIPAAVSTETKPDDIPCMYGIRFFSMLWILLGNTYLYTALSLAEVPVAVNLMDSYDIMKRFTFQAVMSANLATDTFFMISGCLVTYWYLSREERSSSKLNIKTWLRFYAGKYWKMTPPYMLVMVTFVYLYSYLGQGPMWPNDIQVADSCKTDWWKHLLYVNNLVGVDGVAAENQCMAWSWYLAVNMQFYLITPILLSFLTFSSSMGIALIGIISVAGIISAGVKESAYGGDLLTTRTDGGAYWNNVFIKPWCRVAAYGIGMMLGFVIQKWYQKRLNKLFALLGWFLSLCIGILIVYCTYSKFADGLEPWTTAQQSVYEALSRPFWALCVAWVVYACNFDLAGPLGEFFSWKGFVPLSRLTFLVYLIHPVLMVLVVYTKRSLVYIDDFDMAYLFVGHLVMNYAAAFFASLAIDLPFRNLKRVVHGKPLDAPY